ncbi:hypothetical protein [Brevibacillus fluminis]|uniref:hypothetical protein n=1 Tax=Brevibacillus fluminis TaxID=511487 RepID=UPI0011CE9E8C|nr:hypothetical protein [Brevibacillus fluminis]
MVIGLPIVGFPQVGNYVYLDANNDLEGATTFKWYADGVAIPGATSNTYTPTPADVGKIIQLEVTPVALTGTQTGTPVKSPGTAPIMSNQMPPAP